MNTYKTYTERGQQHPNACARSLFELMERKQTNLSVAVDVTTKKELLSIADAVGPFVCVLKVKRINFKTNNKIKTIIIRHTLILSKILIMIWYNNWNN
jgi:orotidine-5'-phosphate decarboxylase